VNTIVGHITGKNKVKKELVKVMGGELIELPSDRFKAAVKSAVEAAEKKAEERGEKIGRAIEIIESGYEDGLSEADVLAKLCRRLNISDKEARKYLEKYKNSEWE
jgi:hypothetical protein